MLKITQQKGLFRKLVKTRSLSGREATLRGAFTKWFLVVLFLVLVPTICVAEDIFVAQNAVGADSGAGCVNAHSIAWLNTAANWGTGLGLVGPGDTVHLCGTFTGALNSTMLTVQDSGSSGSPITIKWEVGAKLTSPAWATSGAIDSSNKAWIIIDGNGTNPSITNTENGTLLANQQASTGIRASKCNNCELKNLTITNMYVISGNADRHEYGVGIAFSGASHISLHNNSFDQMASPLADGFNDGDTDISIYGNTFDHFNHGIEIGNNNSNAISNVYIHDNHLKNMVNWDTTANYHHHDGIFFYQVGAIANSIQSFYVYNNLFDGDIGVNATAWIFCFGGINGVYIFNNVLFNPQNPAVTMLEGGYAGDKNYHIYNNYISAGTNAVALRYYKVDGYYSENNAIEHAGIYQYLTGITGPVVINYNAYAGASTNKDTQLKWDGTYISLNALRALGYDTDSIIPSNLGVNSSGHPNIGSVVINKGTDLTSLGITKLNLDKAGVTRPQGAGWDIGAYEVDGSRQPSHTSVPQNLKIVR